MLEFAQSLSGCYNFLTSQEVAALEPDQAHQEISDPQMYNTQALADLFMFSQYSEQEAISLLTPPLAKNQPHFHGFELSEVTTSVRVILGLGNCIVRK